MFSLALCLAGLAAPPGLPDCVAPSDPAALRTRAREEADRARASEQAGNFAEALRGYRSALELERSAGCADTVAAADLLRQLSFAEYKTGDLTAAEEHVAAAIIAYRAAGGGEGLARALNVRGVLERDRGRYEAAESTFREAIEAVPQGSAEHDEILGLVYNNAAGVCYYRGDYRCASESYANALRLFQAVHGEQSREVAQALNNLGTVKLELGDARGALDDYQRALAIKESVFGKEHVSTASTLGNMALASSDLGDRDRAEALYARAAAIYEKSLGPAHPKLAEVLMAWGEFRQLGGDLAGAAALLERCLAIREQAYDEGSSWRGEVLGLLAVVRAATDPQKAREQSAEAVGIAIASGEQELLWNSWARHARVLAMGGQLDSAVFFGKQAINLVQTMRGEVAALGQPVQRSFLDRRGQIYREMIGWLIALGRLSEAEQVLTMLKEEEYFDYVRSALSPADQGKERAGWSAAERRVQDGYQRAVQRLAEAARPAREEAANAAAKELVRKRRAEHRAALEQAARALAPTRRGTPAQAVAHTARVPPHEAILRYLVSPERVRILLTTASGRLAFETPVTLERLNRLVFELRHAVQDPRADPLPPARALYDLLLRPVSGQLAREQIEHLSLSLDGALRLLPFSALHDGKSFVVEHRSVTVLTLSTLGASERAGADRVAAFGVSREIGGLPALPRVKSELEAIVKRDPGDGEGLVPGVILLDEQFTSERLRSTLLEGYPLVHLASHFVFRPGSLDRSFLLLGDGGRLTLEQIKQGALPLQGVRLLSLSACSTALGEDATGRELESFGTLARRLGAREVMASLWQVPDLATSALMRAFYGGRRRQPDSAAALALAQRSLGRPGPWAHPFYWASFVLLGAH